VVKLVLLVAVLVFVLVLLTGCNEGGMWYIPQLPQTR
jgi:hypothetical protein